MRRIHLAAFPEPVEADLVDALREDGDLIADLCLVAVDGDEVVGQVTCSRAEVEDRPVVALGPIAVLPERQGQGLGSALMRTVVDLAAETGEPLIGLLGDPGFYTRFGFEPGVSVGVLPPVEEWGGHFQVCPLVDLDLLPRGTFDYPAAFDDL